MISIRSRAGQNTRQIGPEADNPGTQERCVRDLGHQVSEAHTSGHGDSIRFEWHGQIELNWSIFFVRRERDVKVTSLFFYDVVFSPAMNVGKIDVLIKKYNLIDRV